MKKVLLSSGLVVSLGIALVGCASTEAGLQKATASKIGGVMSKDISVSDIDRGATSVSWKAKANNVNYSCESDDMVRNVNCVKS